MVIYSYAYGYFPICYSNDTTLRCDKEWNQVKGSVCWFGEFRLVSFYKNGTALEITPRRR